MKNIEIFQKLVNGYNNLAYTHAYIYGFTDNGNVYMVHTDNTVMPYILNLDKASRGAGYALRFKPNKAQKHMLLAMGATLICSEQYFDDMVNTTKYNRGEVFEKLVTEYYGQEWEKDNVPFTEDGDITVDGIAYQIKYQKATFINEKTLMNMTK